MARSKIDRFLSPAFCLLIQTYSRSQVTCIHTVFGPSMGFSIFLFLIKATSLHSACYSVTAPLSTSVSRSIYINQCRATRAAVKLNTSKDRATVHRRNTLRFVVFLGLAELFLALISSPLESVSASHESPTHVIVKFIVFYPTAGL